MPRNYLNGRLGSFLGYQTPVSLLGSGELAGIRTDYADNVLTGEFEEFQGPESGFDWEEAFSNAFLGVSIGAAIGDAADAYLKANTRGVQYDALAANSKVNAGLSQLAAIQTFQAGQAQISRIGQRAGELKASQRARLAANGIAVGTGSAAEITASTDVMKEIDQNTVRSNTLAQAWGYRRQATALEAQAKGAEMVADASRSSAPWAAMGSLLTSASRVAAGYYGWYARS